MSPEQRSEITGWVLMAIFGAATVLLIDALDTPGRPRLDLFGLAAGFSAIITALAWFFVLGVQRSALWGLAMLIPYVNLIAASYYARWYWSDGARAPALLGLAGIAAQTVASLHLLNPSLPPMV